MMLVVLHLNIKTHSHQSLFISVLIVTQDMYIISIHVEKTWLLKIIHTLTVTETYLYIIADKFVFSWDQAALKIPLSVCLSVCPSVCHTFFTMFLSSYHHEILRLKVKVTDVKKLLIFTQIGRFWTVTPVWITNGYEMMHKAWSRLGKVPYCFSMSSLKSQGHTAKKNCSFVAKLGVSGL